MLISKRCVPAHFYEQTSLYNTLSNYRTNNRIGMYMRYDDSQGTEKI